MKLSDIPSKFNIPFANAAGAGYIRTIPQASQIGIQTGAASLTDGFVPASFQSTGSGGVPPFGADFNGLLKQITQWSRWQNAGATVQYDSTFSAAIGGYPAGTVLGSNPTGVMWLSTTDDNTTNPDAGGAGWVQIPSGVSGYGVDTGAVNALVVNLTNPPGAVYDGLRILFRASYTNTGTTTINWGGLGIKSLVSQGANLGAGVIVAGAVYEAIYISSLAAFALIGQTSGQVVVPTATINSAAVNLGQMNTAITANQATSNPGWLKIPIQSGGVYLRQWGTATIPGAGSVTVTFPFAFTNIQGAGATSTVSNNGAFILGISDTAVTLDNDNGSASATAYWEAWGYGS